LAQKNITVSSVDPGWVKTGMGGPSALVEPEKPAAEIFQLAVTPHESGLFWREGKVRSW